MRQAGVLASCGIVSLTKMVDRLADDHRRARALATALSELPGLTVDWDTVQTNLVRIETDGPAEDWRLPLRELGVLCFDVAPRRLRCVLHADIDDAKIDRAIEAFKQVAKAGSFRK
jgi:threonine aldolase